MLLAFLFDSAGFGEWFVLLAVVLVAVGPKNLPSAARKLGQWYARFRRHAEGFKRQLMELDQEMARSAAEADALATWCMVVGWEQAQEILLADPALEGYLIRSAPDGSLQEWASPGFTFRQ